MPDRPKHWQTWEELMNGPTQVSLINEPVDYSVDFVVKETAEERARRIWGMEEKDG
jgi:hypothetical protein